jgi:hypothetical protein
MTGLWIALAAVLALLAALAGRLLLAGRRLGGKPRRARIVSLHSVTSTQGDSEAVCSTQEADVVIDRDALEQIWTPEHLERLARTYWRFLTRVTLGLVKVRYTEGERFVVLLASPLKLLTFQAPEYEMDPARGLVRWRIARGLLVSRKGRNGRGYLQIEVRRGPAEDAGHARLRVEVEVANFYPAIATRISRRLYDITQSRIHVLVTYGFLRSLARLDLAESRVGRLAPA